MSCRSLILDLGVDGSVWWAQVLGVSSLIHRALSFTSHLRLLTSSSSKELLLLLLLLSENHMCLCLLVKHGWLRKSSLLSLVFSLNLSFMLRQKLVLRENLRGRELKQHHLWCLMVWSVKGSCSVHFVHNYIWMNECLIQYIFSSPDQSFLLFLFNLVHTLIMVPYPRFLDENKNEIICPLLMLMNKQCYWLRQQMLK